ncbi:MAG TPA: MFS transporter [Streptosporangiaceae bacterium]|jgi:MFS family permease
MVIGVRDRRARMATYAVFFVQGLCFAALLTRVPTLKAKFGLSDSELSLILLAVPVIAGAGSLLAGALGPKLGSARVLRVAQPLVCVAIVLVGAAGSIPALFAATALFGLTVGAVDATMNQQAVTAESRYGRSLLTGFHAVWSVAGILGALWASLSSDLGLDLVVAFAVPAAIGVIVTVAAGPLLFRADVEVSAEPGAGTSAAKAIPWRPIVLIGLAVTCMYIADSATSSWSTAYLEDPLKATATLAPFAYAAYQAAMVVGRVIGDWAVGRGGAALTVRVGGVIAVVGLLGVVLAPAPWAAIAAFAVAGFGLCIVVPQSFSAAGKLDPAGTGVAVARVNLFNYLGFVLGGAIIGPIADLAGRRVAFAVPMVLAVSIIVLAPAFQPGRRRAAAAGPPVTEP